MRRQRGESGEEMGSRIVYFITVDIWMMNWFIVSGCERGNQWIQDLNRFTGPLERFFMHFLIQFLFIFQLDVLQSMLAFSFKC